MKRFVHVIAGYFAGEMETTITEKPGCYIRVDKIVSFCFGEYNGKHAVIFTIENDSEPRARYITLETDVFRSMLNE